MGALTASLKPILLLHYLALACLEATLIHLLSTLLTSFSAEPIVRWSVLFLVVIVSALATARFERVDPRRTRIRSVTAGLALVTVFLATAFQIRRFGGAALFLDLDNTDFFRGYIALAASMWAWWRGSRLIDLEHADVMRLLRGGVIAVAVLTGLLALGGVEPGLVPEAGSGQPGVAAEIVFFLVLGLVTLSLTRIVSTEGSSTQWRWLRSSVFSALAIAILGLIVLAVAAEPARALLRGGLQWTLYAVFLALSPLFWLIFKLFALLRDLLIAGGLIAPNPLLPQAPPPQDQPPETSPLDGLAPLLTTTTALLLLIPILMLIALILWTTRRRRQAETAADEERESIFTWSALGADLRDLLRGLRRTTHDGGLRAALGRLIGGDPATRIRRRYVQMLLAGEEAGKERPRAATPHEWAPALTELAFDDRSVGTLTDIYEQARYAPNSIDEADARRADAAWDRLKRMKDEG